MRRFVQARAAGDTEQMQRWWGEMVTMTHDRVATLVRIEARGRLSADELREATQGAFVRIEAKLIHSFKGATMGEFFGALKPLIRWACIDVQEAAVDRRAHEAPLAERPGADPDGATWGNPKQEYELARERDRLADEDELDAEILAHGREFLAWALPQLTEKRRQVIELDLEGVPVDEIQERLGMKRDAVYQSRSRGTADLLRLRQEWTRLRREWES